MPRTLITGIAGFTGRYMAALLADQGHEVHGIVQCAPGQPVVGASQLHEGDIADPAALDRILKDVKPQHVIHLAAIAFVAHGDLAEIYRTNVLGTRELLGALARLNSAPLSILLASSANIYGNSRGGNLDENTPPAPANDYGVTKLTTEYMVRLFKDRLPLIVVRPFNYVGRGQSQDFLIPKIVAHVLERLPEIQLGNLDVARDFSDVRCVVRTYARLLNAPAALGGTFNVCSGKATSLRDILGLIQRLSGHNIKVRVNPAFVRDDEVMTLCGTASRLEDVIGPLAMPPLEDTLRWMLQP
jgi:nucleoside-diphosphate-sugar epimerase